MAEALLRARLADVDPSIEVASAGLLFDGRPAERNAVKAMAQRGLDLRDHRSQIISAELLAPASLILGMQRTHVREVVALGPDLFARSFTLIELVHAGRIVGPPVRGETLRGWAERIGTLRSQADYELPDPGSEISDPMGQSARAFRACAETIDARLAELVELAWPTYDATPGDPRVAPATTGGPHADRDRR